MRRDTRKGEQRPGTSVVFNEFNNATMQGASRSDVIYPRRSLFPDQGTNSDSYSKSRNS